MAEYWDEIDNDEKNKVLLHCNAGFGIVLRPSESWNISYGTKLLQVNKDQFAVTYPAESGKFQTEIFDTQAEFNTRKFGLTKINANAGLSGTIVGVTGEVNGSATSTDEGEHTQDDKKTTYYLYAEYAVKKITLTLSADVRELASDFQESLQKVLEGYEQSVQKLTNVYSVLNQKGWYIPTSLTLGGKLLQTETIRTTKITEKNRIRDEFQADFEAKLKKNEVFDAHFGEGVSTRSEGETSSTLFESLTGKSRDIVGGSPQGLMQDGLDAWLTSLESPKDWKVIGLELRPTVSFLPPALLNDLRKLHRNYGSYEEASRHADIDVFKYFGEVETSAENGLAENW